MNSTPSEPAPSQPAPASLRTLLGLSLVGGLAALPLWAGRYLPMVDYPQHLAQAAIIRWYADPVRRFAENFTIVWWAPHSLFKLLVAGLAWLLPIETAGKLAVALAVAGLAPGAYAICRRTGRPAGYALLPLALAYNLSFSFGFVDNLLAYPLIMAALAAADRRLERTRFGASGWAAFAGLTLLFYTVHVQFLAVFVVGTLWLAVVRRPSWRRLLLYASPLLAGTVPAFLILASTWFSTAGLSAYERTRRAPFPLWLPPAGKLSLLPSALLSGQVDPYPMVIVVLVAGICLALWTGAPRSSSSPAAGRDWWVRTRFATFAGFLLLLYFLLPDSAASYVLLAQRLAPLAAMLFALSLPPPARGRTLIVGALIGSLLAVRSLTLLVGVVAFNREVGDFPELLARTAPGQDVAGLVFAPAVPGWKDPLLLHFPAYYQVHKGGRTLFSFAEFSHSLVRYRPGRNWGELLARWDEWNPNHFVYARDAGSFRYFLVRPGNRGEVERAFATADRGLRLTGVPGWLLVERTSPAPH